jgi:hypothetical protein
MAQSDYIKYKRVQRELSDKNKFPNVLNSSKYILYKEYSLENMIVSENDRYDRITDPTVPIVFGMIKKQDCVIKRPFFCKTVDGEDARTYRKEVIPLDSNDLPIFRFPTISNIEKKKRMKWNSILNSKYCKCVNI